jgi:integrase/recombinase XerD
MVINGVVIKSFEKWLQTLGYAESTVNASTNYVRDFFFYLKTVGVTELEQIEASTINSYYKYLQTRTNKRQAGGLSQNYIASNINALKRFSKYLQETGKPFFEVTIKAQAETTTNKTILSQEEIKALYKACENDVLGIRDRAILSIYYGCGLRRSEGIALNVSDILLKEKASLCTKRQELS